MSLRTDERSWIIFDEESIGAVVRMMEAYALSVTGQKLRRHQDQQVRAMGEMMVRMGEHRGWEAVNAGGLREEAAQHFALLGAHVSGLQHDETRCKKALDELHAVVFRLDQKMKVAGSKGPGALQTLVRGD